MGYRVNEVLRLGMRCNFNCLFCNILNNEDFVDRSLGEMKLRVDNLPESVESVTISGGEPTLYPYLGDLVRHAVGRGLDVNLQTNASLVGPERAESLAESGLEEVFINFPSHRPGVYARLTGSDEGAFQSALGGIAAFFESGVEVGLNFIINEHNYRAMESYVEFVAGEFPGMDSLVFSAIQPHGNARINSHLVPDFREVKPYLGRAVSLAGDLGLEVFNPHCGLPMCMVPGGLEAEMNQDFIAGLALRSGQKGTPEDLKAVVAEKVQPPGCASCYLKNFCLGIWKAYHEIRGDVVEPPHRALRFFPRRGL